MKRLKDFILSEGVVTEKKDGESSYISGFDFMSLEDFVRSETGVDPDEKIDEAKDDNLLGIERDTLSKDKLSGYLDKVVSGEKEKGDKYKMPYIHKSNIVGVDSKSYKAPRIIIKDEDTKKEYDLDKLAKQITIRPKNILKQNEKMEHSDGTYSMFYNVGLPAIKGLVFDEKKKEFVVVNTCPGAGECKVFCYATKGGFVQYTASSISQTRILNFLVNDPEGFKKQLETEITKEVKNKGKKGIKIVIRWHDAGDFFSPDYLKLAYAVAEKFPNVDFYAYTKMADVATSDKPENFTINFSQGATPQQQKKIDFVNIKHSKVVKSDLFNDLVTKKGTNRVEDPEKIETLKDRIAEKYNIDRDTILTYSEMMDTPVGDKQKWNVIVMTKDGDDAANRKDVLGTYLLAH
jgi:hypothetical protein